MDFSQDMALMTGAHNGPILVPEVLFVSTNKCTSHTMGIDNSFLRVNDEGQVLGHRTLQPASFFL